MSDEELARREIVEVCHRLYEKGWVANHDGNVSIRVGDDRIVTTPTAVSKGDIRPEMLIVVDRSGNRLEGTRKPFSELALHLKAYRMRADVRAVVHAHPPTASGFAVAGVELEPTFMPEAVVSLGAKVPTTRFALPFGDDGAGPLDDVLDDFDAMLLANHGVLAIGPDLWTAFYRLELVEHLAKIQLVARQLGRVNRLSEEHVQSLLERRRKAGLGPEARGRMPRSSWSGGDQPGLADPGVPALPEGAASSAWTGPYPVGLCSGQRYTPPAPEEPVPEPSRPIPSNEELQQMLAREVQRILGK